jgi:hypothetical protein
MLFYCAAIVSLATLLRYGESRFIEYPVVIAILRLSLEALA